MQTIPVPESSGPAGSKPSLPQAMLQWDGVSWIIEDRPRARAILLRQDQQLRITAIRKFHTVAQRWAVSTNAHVAHAGRGLYPDDAGGRFPRAVGELNVAPDPATDHAIGHGLLSDNQRHGLEMIASQIVCW